MKEDGSEEVDGGEVNLTLFSEEKVNLHWIPITRSRSELMKRMDSDSGINISAELTFSQIVRSLKKKQKLSKGVF